jgi:hypothetical protein
MNTDDAGSPTPSQSNGTVSAEGNGTVPAEADSASFKHAHEKVPTSNEGSTTTEHADDAKANTNPDRPPPVVTALGAAANRPVGGPVPVAWHEGTLTRAYELETLCNWVRLKQPRESDCALVTAIKWHLDAARQAAQAHPLDPRRRLRIFRSGPLIERATSNLDTSSTPARRARANDRNGRPVGRCGSPRTSTPSLSSSQRDSRLSCAGGHRTRP